MLSLKYKVMLFFVFILISVGNTQSSISIPLDKPVTYENRQLYGEFVHINQTSTIQVNFLNVNRNISFIIFQVHSHIYNVTVYNKTKNYMSTQIGTNVGFYSSVAPKLDTFFIENKNNIGLELYVAVFGYLWPDPIPGGCNIEFPQPIAPYVRVTTNENYILADAAFPQALNDTKCTDTPFSYVKFYMMYLPERDFSQNSYFEGLKNMLTLEKILKNGIEIPQTNVKKVLRRMTSAYRGTGVVYVAVAYSYPNDFYSVYTPGYSYACSPLVDGCELLDDLLSRFICVLLLFGGLFICFLGHRFFKTEMFLIGVLTGVVITYILISLIAELDNSALVLASTLSGIFFGSIWCLFWWFYGLPVVSVLLPAMNIGFLSAAIFYYRLPGGILMLQDEVAFWTLFISIMLIISVLSVSVTFVCNIVACAVLGAYAVVYPMDFYFGSNLRYIIINVVRRAIVPEFEKAVLSPPFEWKDGAVTVMWIVLSMSGFLFQQYHNRGRPPFPPPPRSISPRMPDIVDHREPTEERRHWRYLRIVARPRTNPEPTESSPLLL